MPADGRNAPPGTQAGFTLIELSIVLVIIGLIVGGVLVGQDLIRAAEVRATVGQYEKYNASVNTFRVKYNGLPGDLSQYQAGGYGLFQLTNAATYGQGDGNGLIEGGSANSVLAIGETLAFWRHMSDAALIDGSFLCAACTPTIVAATGALSVLATEANMDSVSPSAKMGRGNHFIVYPNEGRNYYHIGKFTGTNAFGSYAHGAAITPQEAFSIDQKVDDGKPRSGIVVARDNGTATPGVPSFTLMTIAAQTGANNTVRCVLTGGLEYNYSGTTAQTPSCELRLRFN
jgi:prepilin-type N-terminal cleavage/methylation domain-containing protein